MASQEHLAILQQGVQYWNRWRSENPSVRPDLSGSVLSDTLPARGKPLASTAQFRGINLSRTSLQRCHIRGADLRDSDLKRANLDGADLRRADLRNSDLSSAQLTHVNLTLANLSRANL